MCRDVSRRSVDSACEIRDRRALLYGRALGNMPSCLSQRGNQPPFEMPLQLRILPAAQKLQLVRCQRDVEEVAYEECTFKVAIAWLSESFVCHPDRQGQHKPAKSRSCHVTLFHQARLVIR